MHVLTGSGAHNYSHSSRARARGLIACRRRNRVRHYLADCIPNAIQLIAAVFALRRTAAKTTLSNQLVTNDRKTPRAATVRRIITTLSAEYRETINELLM